MCAQTCTIPRSSFCILYTQVTCQVYHASSVDASHLRDQAKDIVEALSCYFPVRFTPPKNDPRGVTRQQVRPGADTHPLVLFALQS